MADASMSGSCASVAVVGTSACGQPPRRQDVLIAFLEQAIRETGLAESQFAVDLVRAYRASVPAALRSFELPDLDDRALSAQSYLAAVDAARKRVERYARGGLHLPLELEEAWIRALPEPYRTDCARAVTRRLGFLGVSAPGALPSSAEDMSSVGQVSSGAGAALQDLARMLSNGKFDEDDAALAPQAIRHLMDLSAQCHAVIATIEHRTGVAISRHVDGSAS